MKDKLKVGFIGGGKMAEAIIAGITEHHKDTNVFVYDIDQKRTILLEESYATRTAVSIEELTKEVSIIVVAVKPQILKSLINDNKEYFTKDHLVISIAAGIKLDNMKEFLNESRLIRVMPNTPSLIGEGASVLCGYNNTEDDNELATDIFNAVGNVYWLDEKYFDAVTSLSGSGPAYIYLFIEALIDAGVNEGLPRELARKLALDTVIGSARMVKETGMHPGELKDMVTSPGGTTIKAVEVLEEHGFRNAVLKAISAAARRSKELGN